MSDAASEYKILSRSAYKQGAIHCVKSVQIRSFFWSLFFRIRPEYKSLRIQPECGKIRTRKNSVFGHFSRSDFFMYFHLNFRFILKFSIIVIIEFFLIVFLFNYSF